MCFENDERINNQRYMAIPYALLSNPKYENVDSMSKLVYGALLSKLAISQRNGWVDERGYLYCKASVRGLAKMLGTTHGNISKKLAILEVAGLIERKKISGNADLIFPHKVEQTENDNDDNFDDGEPIECFSRSTCGSDVVPKAGDSGSHTTPIYKNNITRDIHNVKHNNNIESTSKEYTSPEVNATSDVDVVLSTLKNLGFVSALAVRAVKQYGVRRVREAIEIMKSQISTVRNKAAFVYAALKNNYQLTKREEKTSPTVQIVVENAAEVAVKENTSNHIAESTMPPCEPPTEKYAVQARPAVDTESPEKIKAMKDWISRIYKERGSIVKPLQNWLDEHGLSLNGTGDIVPVV